MAGFSGAVEDGARGVGTIVAVAAAVVVGWRSGSFAIGLGVFVAGYVVALIWGHMAGARFRERQFRDLDDHDEASPPSPEA